MDIYTLGIVAFLFILYFVPYLVIALTFRRALPRPGRDLAMLSPTNVKEAQTGSILNVTGNIQSKIPTIKYVRRHPSQSSIKRVNDSLPYDHPEETVIETLK